LTLSRKSSYRRKWYERDVKAGRKFIKRAYHRKLRKSKDPIDAKYVIKPHIMS